MERGLSGLIIVISSCQGQDRLRRSRGEAFQSFKSAELDLPRNGLRISCENAPRQSKSFRGTSGGSGRATGSKPPPGRPGQHTPHAPPPQLRLGQASIPSLTYSLQASQSPEQALQSTSVASSFRPFESLVVFVCLRSPCHPFAHFSGDRLEFTLEVCGAFESIGTCCTLHRQASTVLLSLGAPTGPTPTAMRVEVFLRTIDHIQSY